MEGEIVARRREDQIIVLTPEGKEITVFVDPKTKYELSNKAARFSDLRKGATIGIDYDTRDKQYFARRVVDTNLVSGEVVRVIGKDQVLVKTADARRSPCTVGPETRYQLTEQGGTFTDLRPGALSTSITTCVTTAISRAAFFHRRR